MPELRPAGESEIQSVYRESHALWGAGLSYRAYADFWAELRRTAWARDHLVHCVWVDDDGTVLSSMKVYRPTVRWFGRTVTALGLGAVFTPAAHRRRGHASAMIRHALEEARRRGDGLAVLFTDIGTRYYAALGFQALPAEETWGRLGRAPRTGGLTLRPMRSQDLEDVRSAHEAWCDGRPIAFLRDPEQWDYLLIRAGSFYRRFDGSDLARRYRVASVDGTFVGYLVAIEGAGQWVVREVGARGGDCDTMVEILQTGAAEARQAGLRQLYGWFPPSFAARLPSFGLRHAARQHAIPMIVPLGGAEVDLEVLQVPEHAFLPFLDQF